MPDRLVADRRPVSRDDDPVPDVRALLRAVFRGVNWRATEPLLLPTLGEHRILASLETPTAERSAAVEARVGLLSGTRSPVLATTRPISELASVSGTARAFCPTCANNRRLPVAVYQECALMMVDVDHFKGVNDRHGHAAGDAVLTATARCLQAHVRPYDRIYRYGGEEFLVTMLQASLDDAVEMAERLRVSVAAQEIQTLPAGPALRVTASFGVAALTADSPVEESIDNADKALYQAKSAGRNQVKKSTH